MAAGLGLVLKNAIDARASQVNARSLSKLRSMPAIPPEMKHPFTVSALLLVLVLAVTRFPPNHHSPFTVMCRLCFSRSVVVHEDRRPAPGRRGVEHAVVPVFGGTHDPRIGHP